jgi:WS/DGAT/MGAT family acyltransferase
MGRWTLLAQLTEELAGGMGLTSTPRPPARPRPIEAAPIERASASDRAFLAMDNGDVPEQFGVVLELDGRLSLPQVQELVADRISALPRLRQRLVSTPFGCGGPVWVDDAAFDVRHHVREVTCPAPGDEQAILDTALTLVTRRLRREQPLWSVALVDDPQGERSALVVVLHHVLADGIGGLTILASLVDPGPERHGPWVARPRPGALTLLKDALVTKARAVRGVVGSWRLLSASMRAGGGLRPPRIAPCSLMQRTGPRRGITVVRAQYDAVRAAAHRHGATTNDAVLVVVAGALRQVLEGRGERVDSLTITVPVSGRRTDQTARLGNLVSPMLVAVPNAGPLSERLATVAATVRAGRSAATGPPPIALLGWLFRPLAALGGYRWYMNHQRRFHTLVSHLRGPGEPMSFGGRRIHSAVPIGVAEGGNSTVYFEVFSYDGMLTISAIVDADHFTDVDVLNAALRRELREVCSLAQSTADRD